MMETILVTGLDGSGKSTFFANLRALNNPHCSIVLVPHVDLSELHAQSIVYRTAVFINTLSEKSDQENNAPLKALALFSAMLLFKQLTEAKITHFVFCERHPLIDTPIYAGFYAARLMPGCVSLDDTRKLDLQFNEELLYLITLLPAEYQSKENLCETLLNFIYDWFHLRKKDSLRDLEKLFGVSLPSRIYFLKASPQILFERIRNRERLEAHESIEVLTKLDVAYARMFDTIRKNTKCKVVNINAESVASLTGFFETIKQYIASPGELNALEYYPAVPGRGLVNAAATRMRLDYLQALGYETEETAAHHLDLTQVQHNIESFIGSTEIPVGMVGPLLFCNDEREEMIYCAGATLEGALIASMNRGAKAITLSGGFSATVVHQRMVRAPMFILYSENDAMRFRQWTEENYERIKKEAEQHSNHATLLDLQCVITGKAVHVKFAYKTGDASGQNMTTTCTWYAMLWMVEHFQKKTALEIESYVIEGNAASDKKVSLYSQTQGRGINVMARCTIKEDVIRKVLRTTSAAIVACYGPSTKVAAIDGMTGYNINVANAIAALFAATGQDLASIHESSVGILTVERTDEGLSLSLNLPSLVIGTVGGGTHLSRQSEILKMMGCLGSGKVNRFAQLIAGFALGLEISTYAAIVSGEFAKAHEKLGRNKPVKWLLRSDLTKSFLERALLHNLPAGELISATVNEDELTDNGIITNLAGLTSKKLIGFMPFNVSYQKDASPSERRKVLMKSKALDIDVIKGLHTMAASIDPRLSDLIYECREHLEYRNCHLKEIEMYECLNSANYDFIPAYYGKFVDDKREAFLVFQELLEKQEMHLFNSENSPELWTESLTRKAIDAVTVAHKLFSDDSAVKQPVVVPVFDSSPSRKLYEKLAAIMYSESDTDAERQTYKSIMHFPDELQKLHLEIPLTVVHNDFNPRNVAVRNNGEICIYDWELAVQNIPHRDIVEFLSFVLPSGFSKKQLQNYLDYHWEIAGTSIPREEWNKGYEYAIMEYILTRVVFYKVAGILMKLKFPSRVLDNSLRMLELLRTN
jgi:hydroxymethylglutaryl-CoA reductase (NADPH)